MHFDAFIHFCSQNVIVVDPMRIPGSSHIKWIKNTNGITMIISQMRIREERKDLCQIDCTNIYNGILLSHKKERNWVICRDVDGPGVCHTEWSKSEREKQNRILTHICGI